MLEDEAAGSRPLIVTSADRLDIVLGLLAAQVIRVGPLMHASCACVLPATHRCSHKALPPHALAVTVQLP